MGEFGRQASPPEGLPDGEHLELGSGTDPNAGSISDMSFPQLEATFQELLSKIAELQGEDGVFEQENYREIMAVRQEIDRIEMEMSARVFGKN